MRLLTLDHCACEVGIGSAFLRKEIHSVLWALTWCFQGARWPKESRVWLWVVLPFTASLGVEEFGLKSATMMAVHDEDDIRLWFAATTDGVPLQSLPDTAELHARPNAEVAVTLEEFDPRKLSGRRFSVASGYDEEIEDHVATIYYVEHDDLNENIIEVIAQDGDMFHVHRTGTTTDVNYYDGSKPTTKVEIEAWFKFQDMQKWLGKR